MQVKISLYKNVFSEYEFDPQKLKCIEYIKFLPYLTKEIVRDNVYSEKIPY